MYTLLNFEKTFKSKEGNFFKFIAEILMNFCNIEFAEKINIWKTKI